MPSFRLISRHNSYLLLHFIYRKNMSTLSVINYYAVVYNIKAFNWGIYDIYTRLSFVLLILSHVQASCVGHWPIAESMSLLAQSNIAPAIGECLVFAGYMSEHCVRLCPLLGCYWTRDMHKRLIRLGLGFFTENQLAIIVIRQGRVSLSDK